MEKLCDRQLGAPATAANLYRLSDVQEKTLLEQGMKVLFDEVETPLSAVLFDMERAGFRVDREALGPVSYTHLLFCHENNPLLLLRYVPLYA